MTYNATGKNWMSQKNLSDARQWCVYIIAKLRKAVMTY